MEKLRVLSQTTIKIVFVPLTLTDYLGFRSKVKNL